MCLLPTSNTELPVFLTGGGDGVISEEASESERTLEFIVSRDENVTLDRDVVVTLSTADGSARGLCHTHAHTHTHTHAHTHTRARTHTQSINMWEMRFRPSFLYAQTILRSS